MTRWRDETGRQRKKSFRRKVDADRFRAEVEHSVNVGSYVDPRAGRETLREYAERWRAAQPHRPNTAARTTSQLSKHVYPVLGDRPIAAIRASEVQAFVTGLQLSPSSARPVFATLRAILSSAVRDRVIGHDPCQRIKLPELPREFVVPLTVDQVDALAAAIAPAYRAVVVVGAGTGLRQGELFGLQVADVDFLRRLITVDRQIQPASGGRVEPGPLKNRASYRTIPVGNVVVDALAEHLHEHPAAGETYIFRSGKGPCARSAFNATVWRPARERAAEAFRKRAADASDRNERAELLRRAGQLDTCGMHDLRHWYASALIRAGLSVKVVSARLGHASAAMTLNVYSHLWPDDEDRSRQAIDDVFRRRDVPHMRPAKEA